VNQGLVSIAVLAWQPRQPLQRLGSHDAHLSGPSNELSISCPRIDFRLAGGVLFSHEPPLADADGEGGPALRQARVFRHTSNAETCPACRDGPTHLSSRAAGWISGSALTAWAEKAVSTSHRHHAAPLLLPPGAAVPTHIPQPYAVYPGYSTAQHIAMHTCVCRLDHRSFAPDERAARARVPSHPAQHCRPALASSVQLLRRHRRCCRPKTPYCWGKAQPGLGHRCYPCSAPQTFVNPAPSPRYGRRCSCPGP
jgi:hypothetical protein